MILILNQFSENDPAPTSRYLKEWADDLRSQGKKVQWISSSSSYRKSPRFFLFRILRDFSALLGLGIRGITALSPSLIITSSSPPGMLIMATLLKLWHRVPLIHWAMDIHPDLTFALGEKTPFRSFFKKTMALCYPYCDRVLTLDEGMKNHLLKTYHVSALVTPLWPLHEISFFPKVTPLAPPRWTYSGNLGKAHEWITLLETQHELEKRGTPFVLRLQGNAFQRLSLDLFRPRHLEFEDYVSHDALIPQLLTSHILVATQNPATSGLLWPSKLALLSVLPRPLLWIGRQNSSISVALQQRPHTGIFEPGEFEKIADWMKGYSTLPLESDFEKWISLQPTKAAFLEQVQKELSHLLNPKA